MKISKIEWISENIKEAELTISDGELSCVVFCHPCKYFKNDILKQPLQGNDVYDLMIALDESFSITKIADQSFSYKVQGKILDLENSIIGIGGIKIELDNRMPSWAKEGDYVEFTCDLSIW